MGEHSAWSRDLVVTDDGKNLVSHTGAAALRMLSDRVGLTGGLSAALAQPRLLVHDRGRVFGDLALVIADGAEKISGIDVLGESAELYGPVASVPTAWRTLDEIAEGGQPVTDRITRAVNTTREHVWDLIHDRHGGLPGIRVADKQITGMVGVRLDATLVNVHSEKELASATWKKGFGFHPLLAYCDNTNESLAGLLRTGRAGSNTTADHLTVVDAAIAAIPVKHRRKLLITCDGAGASHGLVDHLHALNQRPGYRVWYTIGWELGERERQAITELPEQAWQQAIDTAGQVRTSRDDDGTEVEAAHVAEITGLLRSNGELGNWPDDMRIIARRELPHPGAQLSLFEQADGYRYQLFATNIPTRPAEPGMANAFLANLSYLDAANRSHARVEDRIRTGKDTGLDTFPSHRYPLNNAWMKAALLAATLLAWFAQLALDGPLAKAEPKTVQLLHVAARFTRGARRRYLKIDETWPLGHPPDHRHRPHPSTPSRTLTHSPPSHQNKEGADQQAGCSWNPRPPARQPATQPTRQPRKQDQPDRGRHPNPNTSPP